MEFLGSYIRYFHCKDLIYFQTDRGLVQFEMLQGIKLLVQIDTDLLQAPCLNILIPKECRDICCLCAPESGPKNLQSNSLILLLQELIGHQNAIYMRSLGFTQDFSEMQSLPVQRNSLNQCCLNPCSITRNKDPRNQSAVPLIPARIKFTLLLLFFSVRLTI